MFLCFQKSTRDVPIAIERLNRSPYQEHAPVLNHQRAGAWLGILVMYPLAVGTYLAFSLFYISLYQSPSTAGAKSVLAHGYQTP
jgi:hypothetical protein